MSDDVLKLAEDFPTPPRSEWETAAEKALRGKPATSLTRTTYEGIEVAPLYTRDDAIDAPTPPGTRGATTWGFRQLHRHPLPAGVNEQILADLEGGVTEIWLRLDRTTRDGHDPDHEDAAHGVGDDGTAIATYADLDRALDGVLLDLAPVHLEAGASFLAAGSAFVALIEERELDGDTVRGGLGADPVGHLAATGVLPQGVEAAWDQLADLAAYTAEVLPNVRAIRVDTQPYVSAGASDAQELAAALSTGVLYLRVLTERGLDLHDALGQIEFTLAATSDQFATIAKLRAFRRLWARVAEASGADEDHRGALLHAAMAERDLTRHDPWVNLLRGTVACFAGAVGGADSVTVLPFSEGLGLATDFGRRIARNTQLILAEESYLDRVADPAAGSWYADSRTDALAHAAWVQFKLLEAEDGILGALVDGVVGRALDETWQQRRADVAKRRAPITGVSEFPILDQRPVETAAISEDEVRATAHVNLGANRTAKAAPVLAPAGGGALTSAVVDAVLAGSSFGQIVAATSGAPLTNDPLPYHRLADDFEALRDAVDAVRDAHADEPTIFLANLGPIAEHTARASFATNAFATGGIRARSNDGFANADEVAAAFTASDADIACICGTDDRYADEASGVAQALKAAGATRVYLAGRPPEQPYEHVDGYVHLGGDIVATVTDALQALEVVPS